jgi:type IV pilus assembly protein PilP
MRLAKSSVTVIALLFLTGMAAPLRAQANPPAKAPQKSQQPGKTSPASKQPAQAPAKAKQPSKAAQAAKQQVKRPPKAKSSQPAKASSAAAAQPHSLIARRDPFNPLVGGARLGGEFPEHLPPGKGGLVVSTLRVDGLVRGPNGMIAVVSNPQQRVYFLREGDQLYDGRVERITLQAVTLHEVGKDAFGKPVERQVIKRLYPSPGEQR